MKRINWWGALTLTLMALSAGVVGGCLFWLIGSLRGAL